MNKQPPPPYSQNPPPPGFLPHGGPPPQANITVVHTQAQVGPDPQRMVCPSCHASISTRTQTEASTKTHIIALLLCIFICWPCVCCPYCIDSCQNTNHYCPNCNAFIGSYSG